MANLWNVMGYSFHNNASLDGNAAPFAVTEDKTNSKLSHSFPRNCTVSAVEIQLSSISSATEVTMYLARDATGDMAFTAGGTTGATQPIKTGFTSATGSVVFYVDTDFNFDEDASNSAGQITAGTIYAVVNVDTGSAVADIRVHWRGI